MKSKRVLFHEISKIFLNGMYYRNPVVIGALGLYPVVAAGYSLRNAVELSLMFLLISFPTSLLSCLIGEWVPHWFRPGMSLLVSAVFYLPAVWFTEWLIPGSVVALGMVASLMICNSIILSRANEYAPTHIGWAAAADAMGCTVGFSLVICLSAVIREFLLNGSLWNSASSISDKGVSLPFFGFILLGIFGALIQWVNQKRERKAFKKGMTRI